MTRSFVHERPGGGRVHVVVTARDDGDFHVDSDPSGLAARRARIVDEPWRVVRQVHGARVVDAGGAGPRVEADGVVTDEPMVPVAVQGADCAPVALVTDSGAVAAIHVGWRGLDAGIVESAVAALEERGAPISHAVIGPAIGPECYAFGEAELDRLEGRFGSTIRSVTADGRPALDLRAGLHRALAAVGVSVGSEITDCTACSGRGFSHRADGDPRRLALVAWIADR